MHRSKHRDGVNIRSLKKNLEEFQHHVLSEMNFRFTIIGVTETRICDRKCSFNFVPELYQDTVLNQSRHLYVPVVLACSLIKIVRSPSNGASISHTSPWSQPFPE